MVWLAQTSKFAKNVTISEIPPAAGMYLEIQEANNTVYGK